MRRIRATVVTAVTALAWLVVLAPPAGAHSSGGGQDASNYLTRLRSVAPEVPGVDVEVIENGDRLQLTNTSDQDVVVLGYQSEPYLRIGPGGVEENLRSPATYLNRERQGTAATTTLPGSADPEAEPDWSPVSSGRTARWHDHRIHWMGGQDPPAVRAAPGERHTVNPEWVVPLRIGDTDVEVTGDLVWIPGPSRLPWLGLAAGLLAVTVAAAAFSPAWRPALAAGLGLLLVTDVVHYLGAALADADGIGDQVIGHGSGAVVTSLAWIAAAAAIVLLARRNPAALPATAFAGAVVALNGGLADVAELDRSQVLFAWSADLARTATAVSLGLGLGLTAAAALRIYREQRSSPLPSEPPDSSSSSPATTQETAGSPTGGTA